MAMHQAARAGEIERAYAGGDPRFDIEHHGCVLSAVINSAAFLEAMVNELYQDGADGTDSTVTGTSHPSETTRAEEWRSSGARRPEGSACA